MAAIVKGNDDTWETNMMHWTGRMMEWIDVNSSGQALLLRRGGRRKRDIEGTVTEDLFELDTAECASMLRMGKPGTEQLFSSGFAFVVSSCTDSHMGVT